MSDNLTQEQLTELSKLRWHCRRGVKELDVILGRYLENHYLNASSAHQKAFKSILAIEDPVLLEHIFGENTLQDKDEIIVLDQLKEP